MLWVLFSFSSRARRLAVSLEQTPETGAKENLRMKPSPLEDFSFKKTASFMVFEPWFFHESQGECRGTWKCLSTQGLREFPPLSEEGRSLKKKENNILPSGKEEKSPQVKEE